jgi:hypothetical protein
MVEEVRPKSKAAQAIRQLATLLAKHDAPNARKPAPGASLLSGLLRRVRKG